MNLNVAERIFFSEIAEFLGSLNLMFFGHITIYKVVIVVKTTS